DWDSFQAFLAVARTGRISAAARRLDVEHTTVSRRLAALEAALGVPLFYRTSTGYLLTPHGQNALAQAEAMERAALALAARAREDSGVIAGRVRVAMAPEFASHWLGPKLADFREQHSHIQLQIVAGTAVALETNSTHALVAAAMAGTGVAVLPRFVARTYGELVEVSPDVAAHDVWLITHPEFRRDPKVRATADFLKRIASERPGL